MWVVQIRAGFRKPDQARLLGLIGPGCCTTAGRTLFQNRQIGSEKCTMTPSLVFCLDSVGSTGSLAKSRPAQVSRAALSRKLLHDPRNTEGPPLLCRVSGDSSAPLPDSGLDYNHQTRDCPLPPGSAGTPTERQQGLPTSLQTGGASSPRVSSLPKTGE